MILTIIYALCALGLGTLTYFVLYHPHYALISIAALASFGYFLFFIFLHVLFVAIFSTVYQNIKTKGPDHPHRFGMFMLEQTSFIIIHFFFGHLHFSGWGKLPPIRKRCMIVSNHISNWDHVGMYALFAGRRMVCVSKKANESIFGAGGWIKYAGNLAIDQHDIKQGQQVIERAGELIATGQASVAIAPEGTRNKEFPDPLLLPFHPGSFQMAMIAKCPIVVIAIQNTNALMPRFPRPTHLYYDCVAVLEYDTYKDMSLAEIASYCHDRILERLNKKASRFYHLKKKRKKGDQSEK